MAILDDLIQQISDEELRNRISKEVGKLTSKKKFGLVYEEHIPECTPLYDVKIKRGANIALKDGKINDIYSVKSVKDGIVKAVHRVSGEESEFDENDVVAVAQFGEPIYPYLKPIDTVKNNPDGDLWHTLIEADNYHALQLLAYLYPHQVDCIYIDPPYNKPDAKDWKYNNNYVDGNDAYRHSKWLSMMEKRLKLSKRLLNPKNSVLIITIDEMEFIHLGMLLESIFPEANTQMISMVINRRGTIRLGEFSRTNEFVFFVMLGASKPGIIYDEEGRRDDVKWVQFRRSDLASRRGTPKGGTAQFYPIYINDMTKKIVKVGAPLPRGVDRFSVENIEGCSTVFPVRKDGTEMNWGLTGPEFLSRAKKGYVKIGAYNSESPQQYAISYLTSGYINDIETGKAKIVGYSETGNVICQYTELRGTYPTTQWDKNIHDAKTFGTDIIDKIIGKNKFTFPKSIYSVKDVLSLFVNDKKDALILDFFAGSGTTLHAINLLNAEDNGNRKCIMVTNNEVSSSEALHLADQGFKPNDEQWEELGIARYVTWPRTVATITGTDIIGRPLDGNYGTYHEGYSELEEELFDASGKPYKGKLFIHKDKIFDDTPLKDIKMSDGFKTNAAYFKLDFLDKNNISLGRQFREMLPLLWMKAGAHHECPSLKQGNIPDMLIYPKNRFAVLVNEAAYPQFQKEANAHEEIETVYIVTDSQAGYREMIKGLSVDITYQLYRDYLDNFRINTGR